MKKVIIFIILALSLGLELYGQQGGSGFLPKVKRTKAQFEAAFSGNDVRTNNMVASQLDAVNRQLIGHQLSRANYHFLIARTDVVYGSYLIDTLGITKIVKHYTIGVNVFPMPGGEEQVVRTNLYGIFSYDEWDAYNILWCKWLCGNSAWPVNAPAPAVASYSYTAPASYTRCEKEVIYMASHRGVRVIYNDYPEDPTPWGGHWDILEDTECKLVYLWWGNPEPQQKQETVAGNSNNQHVVVVDLRGFLSNLRISPNTQKVYQPQPQPQQQQYATGPGSRGTTNSATGPGAKSSTSNNATGPGGQNSSSGNSTGTPGRW